MRLKKAACILLIICFLFTATGCWDSMDVNNKSLVVTVISDRQGEDFAFYIETPNLGLGQNQQNGGSGDSNKKYFTMYSKGTTFADARRHMNAKVDNPIFLGTVKAFVITDELGKAGIEEYMLRMQSDVQYRKTLNVVTSFSTPEDILTVQPPNNVSIGESIDDTIKSLKGLGKIQVYTVSDLLEFIYSSTSFVLPNMDVEDNALAYNGFCVFQESKLIDFIPVEQSKGLVWILGDNIKRLYVVPFDDCEATIEVSLKSKEFKPTYENGELKFDLKFKFHSKVMYLSKNIKFDEQIQKDVRQSLLNAILKDISEALTHSKEVQCDYLQFKEHFRIKYPNVLKNINWRDTYLNASFTVSAETNLLMGSMLDFEASGQKPAK